jgi:hypothetical protein
MVQNRYEFADESRKPVDAAVARYNEAMAAYNANPCEETAKAAREACTAMHAEEHAHHTRIGHNPAGFRSRRRR